MLVGGQHGRASSPGRSQAVFQLDLRIANGDPKLNLLDTISADDQLAEGDEVLTEIIQLRVEGIDPFLAEV